MLDREQQEAIVALMETKRKLEEQVLSAMRNPEIPDKGVVEVRKRYLGFLEKLQTLEDELEAHQKGTPDEWITMWKGESK